MAKLSFRQFLIALTAVALGAVPADAQLQQKWDSSLGAALYDAYNSVNWLYQNGLTAGSVRTTNNVIDDGHGNGSVAGTLNVVGALTGTTANAISANFTSQGASIASANSAITALQTRATTDEANIASVTSTVNTQAGQIASLTNANTLLVNVTNAQQFVIQNPSTGKTLFSETSTGVTSTLKNTIDDGTGQSNFVAVTTDTIKSQNAQQDSLTLNAKTVQTSGDLNVSGNLYVNGVKQSLTSSTTLIETGVLELATNNTLTDMINVGISGNYYQNSNIQYGGVIRVPSAASDPNAGKWVVYSSTSDPGANYAAASPWPYTLSSLVGQNIQAAGTLAVTGTSTFTGAITATGGVNGGAISGSTVTSTGSLAGTSLSVNSGVAAITSAGAISGSAVTATGAITGNSAAFGSSGQATVTAAGAISAPSATLTGAVTANSVSVNAGVAAITNAGAISGASVTVTGAATANSVSVNAGVASISNAGLITGTSATVGVGATNTMTAGKITVGSTGQASISNTGAITTTSTLSALSTAFGSTGQMTVSSTGAVVAQSVSATSLVVNTAYGITSAGAATVSSLAAGSGAISTTGTLGAGAATVTSLSAGSGSITTTGTLGAGAATVTSLNAGAGTISTTGAINGATATFTGGISAQSVTTTSDARKKQDITPLGRSLEKLMMLNPVHYSFKTDSTRTRQHGLVAQELQAIYPEMVKEDAEGYYSVAYMELIAPLIHAVQELNNRLEAIENLN